MQTYSFVEALAIAQSTGKPIAAKTPDIGRLMYKGRQLYAFNLNRGHWVPLNAIPSTYMEIDEWRVLEEREPENFDAECLGIDYTQKDDKYLCTLSLVVAADHKLAHPDFFTNRKVKITVTADEGVDKV